MCNAERRLIASAAIIGESDHPVKRDSKGARGTPSVLQTNTWLPMIALEDGLARAMLHVALDQSSGFAVHRHDSADIDADNRFHQCWCVIHVVAEAGA